MLPGLPLPQNIRRDRAQRKMAQLYIDVIKKRRQTISSTVSEDDDMISILMKSRYRDGSPIPDIESANLMIALLMGGQHNTSATGTWIILLLAHQPHLIEELYQEQLRVLGSPLPPLTYDSMKQLTLNSWMIKETLRLHSPIHSVMRKVTSPMPVPGTSWTIPPSYTLLAAPGFLSRVEDFWPNAEVWDPYRWENPSKSARPEQAPEKEKPRPLPADTVDFGYGPVSLKAAASPYLPFGAGRHRCVGEQYAYLQLGAIIATLVRFLQWEQVEKDAPVPATDYSVRLSYHCSHAYFMSWCEANCEESSRSSRDLCIQQRLSGGAEHRSSVVQSRAFDISSTMAFSKINCGDKQRYHQFMSTVLNFLPYSLHLSNFQRKVNHSMRSLHSSSHRGLGVNIKRYDHCH
jgi:sterol 14-demethylase